MIKASRIFIGILLVMVFITGCQQEDYRLGELITPTNLDVTYTIVGVDADNPYGDGSGQVIFSASADNYITITFDFGDGKNLEIVADGNITHMFSVNGTNTYNVTVTAVGTGGLSTSKTVPVEVYSSFTDDEALEFLTGGSSKKWYWAADVQGHTGLGPNFVDGTNHTWEAWYSAAPWEKTCMYDAEFVFTKTDNGLTFEQTAGPAFIPGTYAGDLGITGDICYGDDVVPNLYGVKNVAFSPSASIATVDGGYRGTTMSFSDDGFMCWWVGVSDYEIIEIDDNTLHVRVAEDPTFAWYHIFTTTKPVQE